MTSTETAYPKTLNHNLEQKLDYKSAGVDITQGNGLVEKIKPLAKSTYDNNVISAIGGFAGLYQLPSGYNNPVLVASTDGVGTKLKLAHTLNQHSTIGTDLVAMCVNDIIVCGAKPLFFLDYYACNALDNHIAAQVIASIAEACKNCNVSLLGGETAEMSGMYFKKDYDLAGFCVGIAERDDIVNPNNINTGDVIIGLSSSGVHSNGFSLVRKILETNNLSLHEPFENNCSRSLGEVLLTPTVLYVDPLHALIRRKKVTACAHITGGGLAENTARIIPKHLSANFHLQDYTLPKIFAFLQSQGNIARDELWRTFNCGIGMVLIVPAHEVDSVMNYYENFHFNSYNYTTATVLGEISVFNGQTTNIVH